MSDADRRVLAGLIVGATLIAGLSARPYAGGWNDGSRLATVESLVDRGTLAIDDSIFVKVPHGGPSPYPADDRLLQQYGTRDKIFVGGHYYSDKSPVPAFYLAAVYETWRLGGGPTAAARPDLFCRLMTWASSGLAFVAAVGFFFLIGRRVGLERRWAIALTVFFALGTVALPYAQQVNNHIPMLAVAAAVFHLMLQGIDDGWTTRRLRALGALAGVGYTIDLAAGPALCLAVGGALLAAPSRRRLGVIALAALPCVAFHHVVNYWVGGTFGPANAVPEYFDWPGSPFSPKNMTGGWHHTSVGGALVYALDMLFGKKGFLGHDLILLLPLTTMYPLLRRRYPQRPVVVAGLAWAAGTWLLYALTSNNQSGACCSIRWFVPLLAPGFVAAAVAIRDRPSGRFDSVLLGIGGMLLAGGMAVRGPWFPRLMPFYWLLYAGTLTAWAAHRARCQMRRRGVAPSAVVVEARVILAPMAAAPIPALEERNAPTAPTAADPGSGSRSPRSGALP